MTGVELTSIECMEEVIQCILMGRELAIDKRIKDTQEVMGCTRTVMECILKVMECILKVMEFIPKVMGHLLKVSECTLTPRRSTFHLRLTHTTVSSTLRLIWTTSGPV